MTGPNLSTIAQQAGTSVGALFDINKAGPENPKGLTNPDVLPANYQVKLPASASGSPDANVDVYAGGRGTAADTMTRIGTGEYTPSPISTQAYQRATGGQVNDSLDRMKQLAGLSRK